MPAGVRPVFITGGNSLAKESIPEDDTRRMEAIPRGVFSRVLDIEFDGEPFAQATHRTFSSTIACELATGPELVFEKTSWSARMFRLRAANDRSTVFCTSERQGFWMPRWDLDLTLGRARLESMGFFRSGFLVVSGKDIWGSVDGRGVFKGGWVVTAWSALDPTDFILIGFIFNHIQKMRAAATTG